ncbi:uncharacterized protein LOC144105597 [Amblyomma americanum]
MSVLYCGFKPIDAIDVYFRRPELEKGRRLYESNHVHSVKETDGAEISAKCQSQQGTHVYDVQLELVPGGRRILQGKCSCRYGILGDYKTSPFVGKRPPKEFSPFHILEYFSAIDSPFTEVLQQMQKSEAEIICAEIFDDALQAAVAISQRKRIDALIQPSCKTLHMLEVSGIFPTVRIAPKNHLQQLTPEERDFYKDRVVCQSVRELCAQTIDQSCWQRWHEERKLCISSTTAHSILRTRRGPEQALASILQERHFSSEATSYGT